MFQFKVGWQMSTKSTSRKGDTPLTTWNLKSNSCIWWKRGSIKLLYRNLSTYIAFPVNKINKLWRKLICFYRCSCLNFMKKIEEYSTPKFMRISSLKLTKDFKSWRKITPNCWKNQKIMTSISHWENYWLEMKQKYRSCQIKVGPWSLWIFWSLQTEAPKI